jgi:hypothetical protein
VGDVDEQVAEVESRLQESSRFVTKFEFDAKNARWAEFSLQLPTSSEKLLLINVVERACLSSVVHEGESRGVPCMGCADSWPSLQCPTSSACSSRRRSRARSRASRPRASCVPSALAAPRTN